jgi:Uma2 family endonuclease
LKLETVKGSDIELAIEVALTSLAYDRGVKSRLYAWHRVREFWVVDAAQRRTWVHTGPKGDGWSSVIELGSEETLACASLPGFALRLDEV